MQPAAASPPPFLLLLGVCLACLVAAGVVVDFTLSFVCRRARVLDPAFAALGLVPSGAIPNVRE
ncbi:MAG: hypothetical protein FJ095_16455 [Deltaproteobacteria bacterium]|nr:hypothetical protein [Deltaproteobacteria bacterium]